eukprot:766858-Hanusia_phi.AAC.12
MRTLCCGPSSPLHTKSTTSSVSPLTCSSPAHPASGYSTYAQGGGWESAAGKEQEVEEDSEDEDEDEDDSYGFGKRGGGDKDDEDWIRGLGKRLGWARELSPCRETCGFRKSDGWVDGQDLRGSSRFLLQNFFARVIFADVREVVGNDPEHCRSHVKSIILSRLARSPWSE